MTLKEKAIELISHYYGIVYPYVGSGYLTGDEDPRTKFKLAQKEALFLAETVGKELESPYLSSLAFIKIRWFDLAKAIKAIKFEDHDWESDYQEDLPIIGDIG